MTDRLALIRITCLFKDNQISDSDFLDKTVQYNSKNELSKFFESYYNSPKKECKKVLKLAQSLLLGQIDKSNFDKKCNELGYSIEILNNYNSEIGGFFNPKTSNIVFQFSIDSFKNLLTLTDDNLNTLVDLFWSSYVHEDTHRQQFILGGNHLYNNYIKIKSNTFYNNLSEKDYKYFDQQVEADAYGREIGSLLKGKYKNNTELLYKDIANNNIQNDYVQTIINIYKDPRIKDANAKKFYRALFDFVEGNEN